MVVGGQPNRRGVVSAASYEARRYGIHSAMPLRTAGQLCPHAVFLEGRHDLYAAWSDRVAEILAKFSPVVEMASIDEAYLDLSGTARLHGPPLAAAHALLREIRERTQLPCSGGLARTRLVAKVASDQAKPRGLLWVPAGAEARFLAPLGVRRIPGIGRVTEAALRKLEIERVEQLAALPQEKLEEIFGRWGTALYRKSRGEDSYEFFTDAEPKSISHSHTFGSDTRDGGVLAAMLSRLGQKAAKRLREAGLDGEYGKRHDSVCGFPDGDARENAACGDAPRSRAAGDCATAFRAALGRAARGAAGGRGAERAESWRDAARFARRGEPRKIGETGAGGGPVARPVRIYEGAVWRIAGERRRRVMWRRRAVRRRCDGHAWRTRNLGGQPSKRIDQQGLILFIARAPSRARTRLRQDFLRRREDVRCGCAPECELSVGATCWRTCSRHILAVRAGLKAHRQECPCYQRLSVAVCATTFLRHGGRAV